MKERTRKQSLRLWLVVAMLAVPAAAIAGLTAQGLTAQGLTAQGLTAQGLTAQGLTAQGLTAQGLTAQGLTAQGLTAQGAGLIGSDLGGAELRGTAIQSIDLHGTVANSDVASFELTSIPGLSTGTGNYITVNGDSAVGHYAVAHMVDGTGAAAEDLDLFIAGEQKDPVPNLFHRADQEDNQDELYVVYFFHKWSGEWVSLCPYNPLTQSASAMAIPEDPAQPNKFIFACTATGVASKCARNWGYRPWASTTAWQFHTDTNDWRQETVPLKDYYDACTVAARAGYCQDGKSFTKAGTLVDLFDTSQIIWPNAVENPFNTGNDASLWMMAQEYFISSVPPTLSSPLRESALQRTRYRELSPISQCDTFADILRLEHDHLEDGRWASPSTKKYLQVFSPTYCTHNEHEPGGVLPWDCSPCTTQVCKTNPECCGAGGATEWTPACMMQAEAVCQTNGVAWPSGMAWPRDLPKDTPPVASKYLLGPGGAVERVEGTSAVGSAATVSGWACDPEWPGSTVAIRIYDAPREQAGSNLLGEVRADRALTTPLANEVSAACDAPGKAWARHGFSFDIPDNQRGNVFVYALDQATADGPPAPPTLIRNGIVHVPTCAHSEHVTGGALATGCSACADAVCGDGTHGSCCSSAWTDVCAEAADSCAPGSASAAANSRAFAAVTTGWIEAPTDGSYVFESSQQASRLFVNGAKVLDWWDGPGATQGSITLSAGMRYHLRWDRFQSEPPVGGSGPGLTWQPPGTVGQAPIPAGQLYKVAPGSGTGLKATYYAGTGYVGAQPPQTDPTVDINKYVAPPAATPPLDLPSGVAAPYSATWEGEVVPTFSEEYSFYVTGGGDATLTINGTPAALDTPTSPPPAAGGCVHNLCELGDKLAPDSLGVPACNPCVNAVCARDPYCCDGGYLSYYSTEPVWDARCITEVKAACGIDCTNQLPTPGTRQRKTTVAIPLQAGVHYTVALAYDDTTPDKTIQLLWSSDRQAKQVIPQFALYPKATPPAGAGVGAGLNVTYFATKMDNGHLKPDLDTVVASGSTADLSITAPPSQTGTPLVDVLASPADVVAATPPPPLLDRPSYGAQIVSVAAPIQIHGIGGLTGGAVHVQVAEDSSVDILAPVAADGTFSVTVPFSGFRLWTLKLVQRTYTGATCVGPQVCAESAEIDWPVTVTPPAAAAPVITSPRDLTYSPNPADNVLAVLGTGIPGVALNVHDNGGLGATAVPTPLTVGSDGVIGTKITLSDGATNPKMGWHKLTFDQGGRATNPVFVSVGIQPPTLEFPRSGAELDCSQPDASTVVSAKGTLPYPVASFGNLRVFEETGRRALRQIAVESSGTQAAPPTPGAPIPFTAQLYNLGYGKHLVYFFQAPDPPAGATQDEIDAHFRNFASIANTPQSRIEINVNPPRLGDVARIVRTSTDVRTVTLDALGCDQAQGVPYCALAFADVNVRIGSRVFTTRANAAGGWAITAAPLTTGWNNVTVTEVVDSEVGGAWRESCPSDQVRLQVGTTDTVTLQLPPGVTVDATSTQGAEVFYTAKAQSTVGDPVTVTCVPPSGSVFPIGSTVVLCTGIDLNTNLVGLGSFVVTVVDQPPVIDVPPGGITAEATDAMGATVSYDVTATDVVSGPVPVSCVPSSPSFFLLDTDTTVTCSAMDGALQTATATFDVRVRDTTPPVLCPLGDIRAGTDAGNGANVSFATCASDLVDGAVPVSCDHASGSRFPVGKTVVTCTATDRHGNTAAPSTFTVTVGDTTPPVLKLPAAMTVFATRKNGARVTYTVTATDNVDPHPKVACVPASGAWFPLGKTTVACTGTDASGNTSQGKFAVRVIVDFHGFLSPLDKNGVRFKRTQGVPVRFELVGPSAAICDLEARLFAAPLDSLGHPGAEQPARPSSGTGNLFDFVPSSDTYSFKLNASGMKVGSWQLRADLGDGEQHAVQLTLY